MGSLHPCNTKPSETWEADGCTVMHGDETSSPQQPFLFFLFIRRHTLISDVRVYVCRACDLDPAHMGLLVCLFVCLKRRCSRQTTRKKSCSSLWQSSYYATVVLHIFIYSKHMGYRRHEHISCGGYTRKGKTSSMDRLIQYEYNDTEYTVYSDAKLAPQRAVPPLDPPVDPPVGDPLKNPPVDPPLDPPLSSIGIYVETLRKI